MPLLPPRPSTDVGSQGLGDDDPCSGRCPRPRIPAPRPRGMDRSGSANGRTAREHRRVLRGLDPGCVARDAASRHWHQRPRPVQPRVLLEPGHLLPGGQLAREPHHSAASRFRRRRGLEWTPEPPRRRGKAEHRVASILPGELSEDPVQRRRRGYFSPEAECRGCVRGRPNPCRYVLAFAAQVSSTTHRASDRPQQRAGAKVNSPGSVSPLVQQRRANIACSKVRGYRSVQRCGECTLRA
mmetsp:Transcript_53156/g.137475  ORF Transcript_53156/g.137475 Transcript_53156/m.137475 type:complete len:240 (+) Transcript_53156:662-1381(+)